MQINKKYSTFLLVCIFSLIMINVPWEFLRGGEFEDLQVYLHTFEQLKGENAVVVDFSSGLSILTSSEVLWKYLLWGLGQLGLSSDVALKLISFVCLLSVSFFVVNKAGFSPAILLLFNPLIIDFVMSQQRSALAFSIFIISLSFKNKFLFLTCIAVSVLIHTASLVLYFSFYLCWFLYSVNDKVNYRKHLITISIIFIVILCLLLSKQAILSFIGDRRAFLEAGSVSIAFASVWLVVVFYLIFFVKLNKNSLLNLYLFFSLIFMFIISTALDDYSLRFLTFSFPFLLVSLSNYLCKFEFIFIFIFIFIYQFIQWVYWFQIFV